MSKEQVVLVVPAELKAWLKQQAQAESRSVNFIATALLMQAKAAKVREVA
ncbi:hypothetical protein [Stenotrophomonas sp. STK17_22]